MNDLITMLFLSEYGRSKTDKSINGLAYLLGVLVVLTSLFAAYIGARAINSMNLHDEAMKSILQLMIRPPERKPNLPGEF